MFTLKTGLGGESFLPNVGQMPHLQQTQGSACGTTSLAMAMTYLGVPRTQEEIDSAIRRWDVYVAPNDLIDYARHSGLKAEGYNKGEWQDVKAQVDKGNPCICFVRADWQYPPPEGGSLKAAHYVVISGYGREPPTNDEFAVFHDPNRGDNPAKQMVGLDLEALFPDFDKVWDDVGWGFHRYYIALASKQRLPAGNDDGAEGALATGEGAADVCNGLSRIGKLTLKSVIRGVLQLFAGVIGIVGGAIGAGLQLAGQGLNGLVNDIPVLQNFVKPIGDILNALGAAIADIGQGVGSIVDDIGTALSDVVSGDLSGAAGAVGDAVSDAASTVVDVASDVVSGAGDVISDVFSGW